jgi:hypothetical protein
LIDGLSEDGATIWPFSNYIGDDLGKADRLIARFADQGYTQIKAYSQLDHRSLGALGKACRERGLRLVGHCPNPLTFEEAIDLGMSCFEHLTNIFHGHLLVDLPFEGRPKAWNPESARKMCRMIIDHSDMEALRKLGELMAQRQVWNCPTATVWQGSTAGPEDTSDPRLDYMPLQTKGWWTSRISEGAEAAEIRQLGKEVNQRSIEVMSLLREEGAPLMVGTDTPNPFTFPGFSVHDEIDNFLAAGYSPYEALRAATTEPARFIGEEDDWGLVAEGMRADLVLVGGDPLVDVRVLRHPWAVVSNGFFLSRSDLDALLQARVDEVKGVPSIEQDHLEHSERSHHLTETFGGVVAGKICCHAIPRPDGGILVEEDHSNPSQSIRRRVFLGPDRKLVRAEQVRSTKIGEESFEIEREGEGYKSLFKGLDGYEVASSFESPPLFTSESFGFSAVVEALSSLPAGQEVDALSFDNDELSVVPFKVSRTDDEVVIEWMREGTPTKQTYKLGPDGLAEGVSDGVWLPREILRDESAS